jgi:peroxiredoxin
VETRGKAKYLGGVGRKITGTTKRVFYPNLQRIRVVGPDGKIKHIFHKVKPEGHSAEVLAYLKDAIKGAA